MSADSPPVFFGRRPLNHKERGRIDLLRRRAEHIRRRILEAEASGRVLHYDRAELSALEWAIAQLAESPALDQVRRLGEADPATPTTERREP